MQIRSLYRKFIFTFSCSYPNTRFCFIKVTRPWNYRECSSVNIGFRYARFTPEHSFLAPKFAASDFWRGYAIASLSLQKAKTYPLISLTKKNVPTVLLLNTIFRQWNCFLWSVATDCKVRHGLKLGENGTIFSRICCGYKNRQKLWLVPPDEICLMSTLHPYKSLFCISKGTKHDVSTELTLKIAIHFR